MLLITGPAGSGKTTLVLDRLRAALRAGDRAVRLLVPTATLAQHLQNRLAREGWVFPPATIQTLAGFVDGWAGEEPQVPEGVLHLIVEDCVRRLARPEFAAVAGLPGFSASLARTIEEFSSAGCDAARLGATMPDAPLGPAFLAVYREVEKELARRKLALRGVRLQRAAARIASEGLGEVRTVLLDGFHALPDPEIAVIHAIAKRAEVTITLADGDVTARTQWLLEDAGFVETALPARKPHPAMTVVKAPSLEREVDEIARRILAQSRPFREIGVVVRSASLYVPLLRAALGRFGIPARFYFDEDLQHHAVIRFLAGAIDAMLGGWEHAATLAVMRLDPRGADANSMDRFAFAVAEQLPGEGLGTLHPLLQEDEKGIAALLDRLAKLDEWRALTLLPADWAQRCRTLRTLFHPPRPEPNASRELAMQWRSYAAVLDHFDDALDQAALAMAGGRACSLEVYWRAVKAVLRLMPLRLNDARRNVVHVLSAHEARQWDLPVVFVCGMVERQFPQLPPQDPYFPEAARQRLKSARVRIRTAGDFEIEERALFDSAISRASELVTLTYPEFDTRGERSLPSIFLQDLPAAREDSHLVRPKPTFAAPVRTRVEIASQPLLQHIARSTTSFGPTTLESFLQCAYQYFGGKLMRLKPAPLAPEDRFNFMLQGECVHRVLQEWWMTGGPVEPIFDRVFDAYRDEKSIPLSYRVQRVRDAMLKDLETFARDDKWPRGLFQSRAEEKFTFELDPTVKISGKIDRIDRDADGRVYIIDYKYSGAQGTKSKQTNQNLLQPALYTLGAKTALGLNVAGMYYIGLRNNVTYVGWDEGGAPVQGIQPPEGWTERARVRTLEAVAAIRAGRIVPDPAELDRCRYCDFTDVCRFEAGAGAEIAEGA